MYAGMLEQHVYVLSTVSLWNDLADPLFDGVRLAGFKSKANAYLSAKAALSLLSSTIFRFLCFLSIGWYCQQTPLSPGSVD